MVTEAQLATLGVDVDATLDRFGGNIDFLEKMLRLFAQGDTLDAMLKAYAEQNAEDLERTSHTIKGSAGNLGLTDLSAYASEVCEAVRGLQSAAIDQALIDKAADEYRRVTSGINAW